MCDIHTNYHEDIVVGKYEPLGQFLRDQRTQEVSLTFREIEKIIGTTLPPKAQQHRAWWSNNASNNVMTRVWLDAGYESAQVNIGARKLVFRRIGNPRVGELSPPLVPTAATKEGRHPLFGALKGLVRIPPGVDLTEPADPDWGKVYD
jgi:hypothetical protein